MEEGMVDTGMRWERGCGAHLSGKWRYFHIRRSYKRLGCRQIEALHLTDISVPRVADVRDTVTLSCYVQHGKTQAQLCQATD
uniref:Uncharacterized protein n=1 Tax=Lutzomyia longipalpis TaxID=7200 RepID=A0A1B0GLA0_LUTLO